MRHDGASTRSSSDPPWRLTSPPAGRLPPRVVSNEGDRAFLHARPELLDTSDEHVLAGRTRLAELGGRVVGFATTVLGDSAAELEDLFVARHVDPDGPGSPRSRVNSM